MTPLEWAHRFAAAGIRVHPVWWIDRDVDEQGNPDDECACGEVDCRSVAKHPIVSTSASTTDPAQVDRWWQEYPQANLGVNTAGITVVDVDFRHGGMESYRLIQPDLPATLRVRTGNGFHEYYSGETEKQGGKLATGIDFKSGPNQQVVGPGSEHMSGAEYDVMNDAALAGLPTRIRELASKRSTPDGPTASGGGEFERDELIPLGSGNNALTAVAAFYANHSRTLEELVGHVLATARASMEEPASIERIREIAEHRWKNHDHTFIDPGLAAQIIHVDSDGKYIFDAGDELDAIFDGTWKPPAATILQRPDAAGGLFYPASINLVFGEDAIGKTWVSLSAAQYVLARGGKVVHLDWDDNFPNNAYRLKLLGVRREEFARYRHKTSPADVRTASGAVLSEGAQLIIVDVVANAISAADLNEDKASDYLKWATDTAIAWARGGACVILNDHVTKGGGGGSDYARGSGAKRGGVDGVAYNVTAPEALLPGEGGRLRLRIQKDRHGSIGARNEDVADLVYSSDMCMTVEVVQIAEEEQRDMIAECRLGLFHEQLIEGWTRADVERVMNQPRTTAQRLIDQMVERGHVAVAVPGTGPRPHTYNLLPPPPDQDA